jgi:predicted DNA-binding protein with PD1-like motif
LPAAVDRLQPLAAGIGARNFDERGNRMKYQTGRPGRIVLARFEDGDDILEGLARIARQEQIHAASFQVIGAIRKGRFVVGPARDEMPPVPVWRGLEESHEIVAAGTIFWDATEPKIHCHGTFARGDQVQAGCLREGAETFLVLEAVVTELLGIDARRSLDAVSGMVLLSLEGREAGP